MQEKLASHEEEWEIMACPSKNRGPNLIVEALEGRVDVVLVASLPPKDGNAFEKNIRHDGGR